MMSATMPNTELRNSEVTRIRVLHSMVCRPASQASAAVENSIAR